MQQPITITLNLQLKLKVKLKDNKAEAEIIDAESEQVEDDDMLLKRKLALMLSTAFAEWSGYPLICNGSKGTNLINYKMWGKTVQQEIPDEYTQLEYIQSSGTQYIDTRINPSNKKIGAVIDFQFTDISRITGGVFGSNNTDGTDNCQFTVYNSKWRVKINSYGTYGTTYDTSRHIARCNMPDGTSLDSTVYTSTQYTIANSNTKNVFVGSCNYGNSTTENYTLIGKLYSAKVYDDTTLLRDFIPAKRNSDEVVGMYDKVSGTFFTNAGTGSFTSGDLTPSPTSPVDIISVGEKLLPTGYTQLEYIQSSGTQWIDTGKKAYMAYSYEVDIQQADTVNRRIFGIYDQNNYIGKAFALTWSSGWAFRCNTTTTGQEKVDLGSINTLRHTFKFENGHAYVDGVDKGYSSGYDASFVSTYNVYLGTLNSGGTVSVDSFSGKIYSYKVKNGNTYVQNLIPAKRNSDEVVGMYDKVSGTFFTNAGSGSFTAGSVKVSYKIPVVASNQDGTETTTTNIYLSAPLRKVGDYADYIDFENQQVVRNVGEIASYNGETITTTYISSTGGLTTGATVDYGLSTPTTESIELPALPTFSGYTKFETSTTVKPSDMYGKG